MERTRNFVLLLFAIVMVVSLVVFYAPRPTDVAGGILRSEETAAKVGGDEITVGEIATQKESVSSLYGQAMPAKALLNTMISSRIVSQEAERLGLRATDAEVAASIRERFKPADGKPFDQKLYEQNVTERMGSIKKFEESIREELSGEKLRAFLTAGVTVSEEEVLEDYKRQNTKFDVTYVPVSVADLAQTIKPSDEELRNYFEQNKKAYFISSPQKKIRYVFLDTAKIGEKLNISEADLKAEYDKLPDERKIAGVQGQEIVLRVPKQELEVQVSEKANQLVETLRKDGETVSEEGFAEIAKGQSENPNTARNGGKIPGLIRENPNNPEDPYQRLLKMEPGEITEPISYQGRYFILRRGEAVPKSFEEAKKELDVSLRNRRAYAAAAELAQKVTEDLQQTKDAQQTAQKFAAEANMSVNNMVRETDYIKPGDTVENIGVSQQFEEGIAPLAQPGEVGEKIPIPNGFAIPLLVDQKEPRDAEFEEVRAQILETVKIDQARARVEEIAKQIAANATSAGNLNAAAQSSGLKAQEQKGFILGSPLGQGPSAATGEALETAVYGLREGEVTKQPVKVGDNWYIVGVNKREEANMNEFAQQREQLLQQKLMQKRGQVFSDFIASARQRMEQAGQIKIYPDALAKIDEAMDADQPQIPQMPQFPGMPPQGE